jgi:hypothetical protein
MPDRTRAGSPACLVLSASGGFRTHRPGIFPDLARGFAVIVSKSMGLMILISKLQILKGEN